MENFFIYTLLLLPFIAGLVSVPGKSMAMMQYIPFDEIVVKADLAFVGTVVDKQCRYTEKPRMIDTDVTFSLDRVLFVRDRAVQKPEDEIILTFAGGETAEGKLLVSDVPEFDMGRKYIILARSNGKSYMSSVVGGTQGLFKIMADETTTTHYPLTYSNRALSGVDKSGKIIPGPRASQGIAAGKTKKIISILRDTSLSTAIPQPVSGTGAISASLSTPETRKKAKKDETLMNLDDFLARILQMHASQGEQ